MAIGLSSRLWAAHLWTMDDWQWIAKQVVSLRLSPPLLVHDLVFVGKTFCAEGFFLPSNSSPGSGSRFFGKTLFAEGLFIGSDGDPSSSLTRKVLEVPERSKASSGLPASKGVSGVGSVGECVGAFGRSCPVGASGPLSRSCETL